MAVDRSRLPEVGPDPAFVLPQIARHTLANGLQLRTVEYPGVPVVTFVMQIAGGSGADVPGREGLAAIVADMADEGTGAMNALDVSEALARIGADYDVDVASDTTMFTLTTLSRFASRGASLLADMIIRPRLEDADFERIRQLRLDRLRQLKDLPAAVAERTFLQLLYGNHPYGHLAIGNDRTLRGLSLADVSAFHAATIDPSRAVLVAVGAMSHDLLLATAASAFESWQRRGPATAGPEPAAAISPDTNPPRLAIVPRERAAQSELRIGHLSVRRDTPDYAALVVMNAVLGGQFVSRINLKLREEKGYTYGARTGFDWRVGVSPFGAQASVHTASTADAVRDALGELSAIRDVRPPTSQELFLAQASLTRGYARNFETAQQVARSVAQLALFGLPDSYFENFAPRVNAVTVDEVVRVAREHLDPQRMTTLIVGDHSVVGDSLRELGLGDPQLLPLDG